LLQSGNIETTNNALQIAVSDDNGTDLESVAVQEATVIIDST